MGTHHHLAHIAVCAAGTLQHWPIYSWDYSALAHVTVRTAGTHQTMAHVKLGASNTDLCDACCSLVCPGTSCPWQHSAAAALYTHHCKHLCCTDLHLSMQYIKWTMPISMPRAFPRKLFLSVRAWHLHCVHIGYHEWGKANNILYPHSTLLLIIDGFVNVCICRCSCIQQINNNRRSLPLTDIFAKVSPHLSGHNVSIGVSHE